MKQPLALLGMVILLGLGCGVGGTAQMQTASPIGSPMPLLASAESVATSEGLGDFRTYTDGTAHVALDVPSSWVTAVSEPGHLAVFQSYAEGKYTGGGAFLAGDTKCDLIVFPLGSSLANEAANVRTGDGTKLIEEQSMRLQGRYEAIRFHLSSEAAGETLVLVADLAGRIVAFACYGSLAPFDPISQTLRVAE